MTLSRYLAHVLATWASIQHRRDEGDGAYFFAFMKLSSRPLSAWS